MRMKEQRKTREYIGRIGKKEVPQYTHRHGDIVAVKCPFCSHDSAFDKSNSLGRYKCSKCGHYWTPRSRK